jgi:hypothetical protein
LREDLQATELQRDCTQKQFHAIEKQDCIQLALEQADCTLIMRRLVEFQAIGLSQGEE